jgi:hypothetical protein
MGGSEVDWGPVEAVAAVALLTVEGASPWGGDGMGGAPPSDLQLETASAEIVPRNADRRRRFACIDSTIGKAPVAVTGSRRA